MDKNNDTRRSYEQALNLDAGILQLLLERNRLQHFRSAYFRRLEMLLRSIHKYKILQDQNISQGLGRLITSIQSEHDRVASILERYKGIHKRRGNGGKTGKNIVEEEHWTIKTSKAASACGELELVQTGFLRHLKELKITLTEHIPEILSRILYAAEALYIELSRGYFAPLCTVALAAISRIRVLLLQLGRDGTLQLQRTLEWLKSDFCTLVTQGGELEETTGLYLREVDFILSHCKVESWEDLMNSFIELDNEEHTSAMAKRRMEVILSRGSDIASRVNASISNGTSDIDMSMDSYAKSDSSEDGRKWPNESVPPDSNVDDEIGELVESKTSDQEVTSLNEKKDDGDRNLEMIAILKGKVSKRKRERLDIGSEEKDRQSKKAAKVKDNSSTSTVVPIRAETKMDSNQNTERKKEKKTKKKKAKKKKKKSKDVIDDIFGDL